MSTAADSFTPSFGGYVAGVLVSGLCFLLPGILLGPFVLVVVVIGLAVVGLPVGVAGALIVHWTCRHEPRQGVHVAVAAACGAGLPLIPLFFVPPEDRELPWALLVAAFAGLCAAVGRAVVTPRALRSR